MTQLSQTPPPKLKIAIVAGEVSGDHLGMGLMQALKQSGYDITFMGIGGDKMKAEGLHSFFEMDRLSVMGVFEPLCRLPELLKMRRFIIQFFTQNPPDVYIGIDAPDFNLGIARILKSKGIKTMHYVSPTIWAWRPGRIKKIMRALNHILLIFPFEADIYQKNGLSYDYVGHPLAEEIPFELEKQPAREQLMLDAAVKPRHVGVGEDSSQPKASNEHTETATQWIAILPGSRASEIKIIADSFIKTAQILYNQNKNRIFLAAMINQEKADLFKNLLNKLAPELPVKIIINQTRTVLQACDVAMVVSGTATLETALMKRPFIVGYKMQAWQFFLAKRLIKVDYIAMPNIIANKKLVTEYIQEGLNPVKMAKELEAFLDINNIENIDKNNKLIQEFKNIHTALKQNGSQKAANAVLRLVESKP